jgi:hypothetical protein
MVNRALSQFTRKHQDTKQNYARRNAAASAYQSGQAGLRRFAAITGVPRETIRRRAQGLPSRESRGKAELKVPVEAEEKILEWIIESSDRAHPPGNMKIKAIANQILAGMPRPPNTPPKTVGKQWVSKFKRRHHDALQTSKGSSYSSTRASALTQSNLTAHFTTVLETYETYNVRACNVWAMDETGLEDNVKASDWVVGRRGVKRQHVQQSANRELTTVVGTICADGEYIPPMVIFKGEHFRTEWGANNPGHALCVII